MNVVIYARFSSPSQTEQSIEGLEYLQFFRHSFSDSQKL